MDARRVLLALMLIPAFSMAGAGEARDPFAPKDAVSSDKAPAAVHKHKASVKPKHKEAVRSTVDASPAIGGGGLMLLPPPLPPSPRLDRIPDLPSRAGAGVEASPAPAARRAATPASKTQAVCSLKVKSQSVAAPATGGIVSIQLLGKRECVTAVLIEQPWLQESLASESSSISIEVDANALNTPRQSNIVLANAAHSVTITLVQEARPLRTY